MKRLLSSIKKCVEKNKDLANFELLIINDSPEETVCIPDGFADMNIRVICNECNMGIQKTRVNGLKNANGEWIIFLDQDDELVCDGFRCQISMTKENDVVVGNGIYQFGSENRNIFFTSKEMQYLLQLSRFIKIRNLIPSPGECLIRKNVIPDEWVKSPLRKNGADDWLLWILLFKRGARVGKNQELVYIHHDTDGNNLSTDLEKMKESAFEMWDLLVESNILTRKEEKDLGYAIAFKYLQDTGNLNIKDIWKYRRTIVANIVHKVNVILLRKTSKCQKGYRNE